MRDTTTVQIHESTWRELNRLRDSPGDTFDAIICRLLEESDSFYEPREVQDRETESGLSKRCHCHHCMAEGSGEKG